MFTFVAQRSMHQHFQIFNLPLLNDTCGILIEGQRLKYNENEICYTHTMTHIPVDGKTFCCTYTYHVRIHNVFQFEVCFAIL